MRSLISAAAIAIITILIIGLFPSDSIMELKSRDLRAGLTDRPPAAAPIVIVAIDDASFNAINLRWPWPRQILAEGINIVSEAGARVIGLDIALGDGGYFPGEDEALAEALVVSGNVVIPAKVDRREQGGYVIDYVDVPLDIFSEPAGGMGYVNLLVDKDGFVRRLVPMSETAGSIWNAFAIEILSVFNGDARFQTGTDGSLTINYADNGAFPVVPFHEVLAGSVDMDQFDGAIVLIGAWFKESHDLFLTPVESVSGLYGVEVHAHVINMVLTDSYLSLTPRLPGFLLIMAISILSAALFVWKKPKVSVILAVLLLLLIFSAGVWVYDAFDTILEMIRPLAAVVIAWVSAIFYYYLVVDREKRAVRSTFSRFVSKEVVDRMLDSGSPIELGGETREVAIFFSDICGFTTLSERMSPAEVVEMLNAYFTEMTDIVFRYEGTLNKYIGDAIMAFYGAPVVLENPGERAVMAALEMRDRLAVFNADRQNSGKEPVRIGMGIHIGSVLVGNIGSPRQMEYTVIGDAVNVASRIEGLTRKFDTDLLISEELHDRVSHLVYARNLGPAEVKGKSEPVIVFDIKGLKGDIDE